MSDSITENLSKYGDYDEAEVWDRFKENFLLKGPRERIENLKSVDIFIESHMEGRSGVTKELGSLLAKKRDLELAHRRLRELNR